MENQLGFRLTEDDSPENDSSDTDGKGSTRIEPEIQKEKAQFLSMGTSIQKYKSSRNYNENTKKDYIDLEDSDELPHKSKQRYRGHNHGQPDSHSTKSSQQ
ncbi:hypothetical protein L873DRAFT_1786182 [Choiromyces venosus 120613-1]|uniref:Uncharacterized protein n=1 Tax=Choiromyces venosus 120613-1 TaxID=1336337 RepID=A0A3N4K4R8_9PEZI|nr:hypothetical protein L873DRAFT_1786182 [Choiromyces venosus 120613-1]